MDRMILPLLGALFLLLMGAGSVWFYDYHEPIGFHATVLWWHPGFDLPNSLETQLEQTSSKLEQAEAQLKPWQNAYNTEKRQLDAVNAGQQAVVVDSQAKLEVAQSVAKAQVVVQSVAAVKAHRVEAALPLAGSDVCQRAEAVDAAFLVNLK